MADYQKQVAEGRAKGLVTFYSRSANLRVVRRPHTQVVENGMVRTAQNPVVYQFVHGVFHAKPGRDRMVDSEAWLRDDEDPGVERDQVEALLAHRNYGVLFHAEGHEVDRQLPTEEDFLRDVNHASMRLDEKTLERLISEEDGSHKRPVLLTAARDALNTVREVLAEMPENTEKQQAKAAARDEKHGPEQKDEDFPFAAAEEPGRGPEGQDDPGHRSHARTPDGNDDPGARSGHLRRGRGKDGQDDPKTAKPGRVSGARDTGNAR